MGHEVADIAQEAGQPPNEVRAEVAEGGLGSGMEAHGFDLSTQKTEKNRCLRVLCQPDFHGKFQASQGYIWRFCLKK